MIQLWLAANDWIIIGILILLFSASASLLHYLCFRTATREFVLTFSGIVAPFFVMAATIFALTTALLGSSVWQNFRDSSQAVRNESQAIAMFTDMNQALPQLQGYGLIKLVKNYTRAAVEIEWDSLKKGKKSKKADDELIALLSTTILAASTPGLPDAISRSLMKSVDAIVLARTARLSLLNSKTDPARWVCVILLALLTQIGIVAVHLEKSRACALALFITTITIVVALGLIALTDAPHSGVVAVSIEPLQQILRE